MKFYVKKFHEIDTQTIHNIFSLRADVFIVEQKCIYQDIDGKDPNSIHIIGKNKEEIVVKIGTIRSNLKIDGLRPGL